MNQLIVNPTRITSDKQSLLDIIATNRPEKVLKTGVIHLGISDHSLHVYICLKISVPKDRPKIVETRNFKNYNNGHFSDHLMFELNKASWNLDDTDLLWAQFKNIFNSVSDTHAPVKTRKVRSTYAPWLTTAIRREMNQRDHLKKKAVKNRSECFNEAYKVKRNQVNK